MPTDVLRTPNPPPNWRRASGAIKYKQFIFDPDRVFWLWLNPGGSVYYTVADGNGLLQTDVFKRGDGFENFSFSPTVDDVTGDVARYFTVFDFKHIGKNVVQVQSFLQSFTEIVKAAGDDAALVAKLLQGTGQNSSIHRSGKSQKTRCLGRNLQCIGYGG